MKLSTLWLVPTFFAIVVLPLTHGWVNTTFMALTLGMFIALFIKDREGRRRLNGVMRGDRRSDTNTK